MKNQLSIVLVITLFFNAFCALSQSIVSDSLFVRGMERYRCGKYVEAIPLFEKCDKMDKELLGEEHSRAQYANHWLASCYYKIGQTQKAKSISEDYFNIEPIDRTNTIRIDSLFDEAQKCLENGEAENALMLAQEAYKEEKMLYGENSVWCANSLIFIAHALSALAQTEEAYYNLDKAISLIEELCGRNSILYAKALYQKAEFSLYINGDVDKALQLIEEIYDIGEKEQGKTGMLCQSALELYTQSFWLTGDIGIYPKTLELLDLYNLHNTHHKIQSYYYAILYTVISDIQAQLGDKDLSFSNAKKAYNYYIEGSDTTSFFFSQCVWLLMSHENERENFEGASKYAELGINTYLQQQLPKDETLFSFYFNYAEYQEKLGRNENALIYYRRAEGILDEIGKYDFEHFYLCGKLADYFLSKGDTYEALRYGYKQFDVINGNDNLQTDSLYAFATGRLARCYSYLSEQDSTLHYTHQFHKYLKDFNISENLSVANYIYQLHQSYLLFEKDFEKCLDFLNIGYKIVKKVMPNTDLEAQYIEAYAELYAMQGNFIKAIDLQQEACKMFASLYGTESDRYKQSLLLLIIIKGSVGNTTQSLELLSFNEELKEDAYSLLTKDGASPIELYFGSSVLQSSGDLITARLLSSNAIHLLESNNGTMINNKMLLIKLYIYSASLDVSLYEYDKADENLSKAKELIVQSNMSVDDYLARNPFYYYVWVKTLFGLGKYNDAMDFALKQKDAIFSLFGSDNVYYMFSMLEVMTIYWKLNTINKACDVMLQLSPMFRQYILSQFTTMSSEERMAFWSKFSIFYESLQPYIAANVNDGRAKSEAYDGLLLSKGLLLNTEQEIINIIRESGNSEALLLYERMLDTRKELVKLQEQGTSIGITQRDSLRSQLNTLERQLATLSTAYNDYTRNLNITWQDVQKKLGDKDVAIEFACSPDSAYGFNYYAFVISKKMPNPETVILFNSKDYDLLPEEEFYTSDKLFNMVWEPLEKYLSEGSNVYFSPAGVLHNTAIEYLIDANKTPVNHVYSMHRLSSTRELAIRKESSPTHNLVIYGGINFKSPAEAILLANNSNGIQQRSLDAYERISIDSIVNNNRDFRLGIMDLPGTLQEANEIFQMYSSAQDNSVCAKKYIGDAATEESVKSLSGQTFGILHIATHGLFITNEDLWKYEDFNFIQANNQDVSLEDKILSLSGLLMAGAGQTLSGVSMPDNMDDGILTSSEIARLDLRSMDLVVLSACETAKGQITGEGVFGLQRGFKKAGVQSLLMSLWKVDDRATQILMTEFYKNLLKGVSKHVAFQKAQEYLRTIENGKYDKPEYWAAFILVDSL